MSLVVAIALFIAISVLVAILNALRGRAALPYQRCDSLLTAAERSFYEALRLALGNAELVIFAKVRMWDLLCLPSGTPEAQGHRNRVMCKHVDFVLCDRQRLQPLLVIELDDRSHERQDRRDRDAFVDAVFAAAQLPILHVPCRKSYAPKELAQQIWPMLQPQGTAATRR